MINVMLTDLGKDTNAIAALIAMALKNAGFENIETDFSKTVSFPPNKPFTVHKTEPVNIRSYSSGL